MWNKSFIQKVKVHFRRLNWMKVIYWLVCISFALDRLTMRYFWRSREGVVEYGLDNTLVKLFSPWNKGGFSCVMCRFQYDPWTFQGSADHSFINYIILVPNSSRNPKIYEVWQFDNKYLSLFLKVWVFWIVILNFRFSVILSPILSLCAKI